MTDFWMTETAGTAEEAPVSGPADCFGRWQHCFGWPGHYWALDLVTTGLRLESDLIVEIGYCTVRNRQVVERGNWVLDWTQEASIDQDWLRHRLQDTAERMAQLGRIYPFTWEQLHAVGIPPRQALDQAVARCQTARQRRECVVGHNLWAFDAPWLRRHGERWLGATGFLDANLIIDVGLLEKARQLNLLLNPGESLDSFWRGVSTADDQGIRWALHTHCLPSWDLTVQQAQLRNEPEHADGNAYLAHLLLEAYHRHTSE